MSLLATMGLAGRLCVLGGVLAGTGWDIAKRIVPNGVVVVVGSSGLAVQFFEEGWWGLLTSMGGAACVLAVLCTLAAYELIGGGDAKLIAAVSLGIPVTSLSSLLLAIAVSGGVVACWYLLLDRFRDFRRSRRGILGCGGRDDASDERVFDRAVYQGIHGEVPYSLAVLGGLLWYQLGSMIR